MPPEYVIVIKTFRLCFRARGDGGWFGFLCEAESFCGFDEDDQGRRVVSESSAWGSQMRVELLGEVEVVFDKGLEPDCEECVELAGSLVVIHPEDCP